MSKVSYMEVRDKINELTRLRKKKEQGADAYVAMTGTLTALLGMMVEGTITSKDVMYTLQSQITEELQ